MIPNNITILLYLPVYAGFLSLLIKKEGLRRNFILSALLINLLYSVLFFIKSPEQATFSLFGAYDLVFGLNALSSTVLIFVNLFSLLICLYSGGNTELKNNKIYFSCLAFLSAASNMVCFAGDFISFIFGWGACLFLLYVLIGIGSREGAYKALVVVGLGDFALILGVCLYIFSTGTTIMPQAKSLALSQPINWASFILMLLGAAAKAGCLPMHTWIPAASQTTPGPIMAILPASLDKLLGIYLLARICLDFFMLTDVALAILLIIGSLTIIVAVMMALVQHDLRKLLSYHAISQVGYMVLGFGTGTAIGFSAGVFHMINHAIYKSGLFLSGSSVGEKRGTYELDNLGALAKFMPVTFTCALFFALSISGIPPFNGFASKWMLYQAHILALTNNPTVIMRVFYIFGLTAAMFGSVLTLASFIKFIHAVFLGETKDNRQEVVSEVCVKMRLPVIILAALCLLIGIFPYFFLRKFINPWLGAGCFLGAWDSWLAFILLLTGMLLGIFCSRDLIRKKIKIDNAFVGGEKTTPAPNFPATEFYRTFEELPVVKRIYVMIKNEAWDVYNIIPALFRIIGYLFHIFIDRLLDIFVVGAGYIVLGLSWIFRKMHTGILDLYIVWSLLGLIVLMLILMVR